MIAKGRPSLDKDSVLSKVSDVDLLLRYFPNITEIPSVISSPLRRDEHPSFRIYSPDGTKIRWYDYVTGESGGMLDLLQRTLCVTFDGLLQIIETQVVPNGGITTSKGTARRKLRINSTESTCQVRSQMRNWEEYDFQYWESYGVPRKWLLHADIYPISHIFIVSESGYVRTIKADKYAYTFVERKDGICSEKVYQPYNKLGMKWRSGHDSSVWDLWTKLPPRGEKCIITSSRKDALCIWANSGIPSVSLQGEAVGVKPQVMEELKGRFKEVFVLYDNDMKGEQNYGRIDGKKLADQFGITQIEIPDIYLCKDISDLYKKYGHGIVVKVLEQLCRLNKSTQTKNQQKQQNNV